MAEIIEGTIVSQKVEKSYTTYPVRMAFQAGYAQYKAWPSGTTYHSGIGYFHPFGQCRYYMGEMDMAEAAGFPIEKYFTQDFIRDFCDLGFAVYEMQDGSGSIYALDGVFGTLVASQQGLGLDVPSFRNDVLLNVVVGGTGKYENATGILTGTAEGSGEANEVHKDFFLPEGLLKLMDGYLKIPDSVTELHD